MMNKKGSVIYVGKAKNLKSRVRSYFSSSKSLKNKFLSQQIHSMDYILTDTETEALLLEAVLVKKHKPRYNIRLKDDKSYPYIRVSMKDAFPRFYLERRFKKDGSLYFGPYTESYNVRTIIRFLNETYQVRDCSNGFMKSRKTPCITHQMGYCTAPCVGDVNEKKYSLQVQKALDFLKGRGPKVIDDLKKQMKKKADQQFFEQALSLKNRIISIEKIWEKQSVWDSKHKDFDILSSFGDGRSFLFEILHIRSGRLIGHFSHFEKEALWQKSTVELKEQFLAFLTQYYMAHLIPDKVIVPELFSISFCRKIQNVLKRISEKNMAVFYPKGRLEKKRQKMAEKNSKNHFQSFLKKEESIQAVLLELKKKFHLPAYPERMECYDISHFQSQAVYASQVVFENGVKKPQDYRIYKLKEKNDDYLAMKQVLSRRFSHKEIPFPQLILIDGGKGQLKTALRVLKEMDLSHLSVLALAKEKGTGKVKNLNEKIFMPNRKNPVVLLPQNKVYQMLARLRDEAHRFAISRHRKKIRSTLTVSALDSVKGIGEKRKLLLLKKFKTVEKIKNMDPLLFSKESGFSEKLSRNIISSLKKGQ